MRVSVMGRYVATAQGLPSTSLPYGDPCATEVRTPLRNPFGEKRALDLAAVAQRVTLT